MTWSRRNCCTGQSFALDCLFWPPQDQVHMLPPSSAGTPENYVRPTQRPATCEISNKYCPILSLQQGSGQQPASAFYRLHTKGCILFFERRWQKEKKGSVSLNVPWGLKFSPSRQVGGNSHIQISIWTKGPTKFHDTAKALKFFSWKEFQSLLPI